MGLNYSMELGSFLRDISVSEVVLLGSCAMKPLLSFHFFNKVFHEQQPDAMSALKNALPATTRHAVRELALAESRPAATYTKNSTIYLIDVPNKITTSIHLMCLPETYF